MLTDWRIRWYKIIRSLKGVRVGTELQTLRFKPDISLGRYYKIISGNKKGMLIFVISIHIYFPQDSLLADWAIMGYGFHPNTGATMPLDIKGDETKIIDTTPLSSDEV
ncbi:MAG TPA: hypothetical protein PK367_03230, partial [Candidatus Paceibacterota bacterium]|nr:hypothetical protein [Candidatus Paceibacterota bacterium]